MFFDDSYISIIGPNSRGKVRRPNTKTLAGVLRTNDENFLDFIAVLFCLNF
jgi:hypothetical protein